MYNNKLFLINNNAHCGKFFYCTWETDVARRSVHGDQWFTVCNPFFHHTTAVKIYVLL